MTAELIKCLILFSLVVNLTFSQDFNKEYDYQSHESGEEDIDDDWTALPMRRSYYDYDSENDNYVNNNIMRFGYSDMDMMFRLMKRGGEKNKMRLSRIAANRKGRNDVNNNIFNKILIMKTISITFTLLKIEKHHAIWKIKKIFRHQLIVHAKLIILCTMNVNVALLHYRGVFKCIV